MLLAFQNCATSGHDPEGGKGLSGEDWPQWRGPSSNGVSSETNVPERWSADSNIVWKAALAGLGGSSPCCNKLEIYFISSSPAFHTVVPDILFLFMSFSYLNLD